MLLNIVHHPGFEPLDYQARFIPTRPWHHPRDLEDHFMVYIMVMTGEKVTELGHDQVTCLEASFIVVLLMFNNLSAEIFA